MTFSKEFSGNNPLGHIGTKKAVYIRFLELCVEAGWDTYVLTKKTYKGNGIFEGVWKFSDEKFTPITEPVKINLVYDRSAGVSFPPDGDKSIIFVNRRDFKVLCWDKWKAYAEIGEYMPKTETVKSKEELPEVLSRLKTDTVVLKPYNGLKGIGVYIGPKDGAESFEMNKKYKLYIAQEFVDTSGGIAGITTGLHDLRLAIVNTKVVWSHVRVPPEGSLKANAAAGGILTEVSLEKIPENVLKIAEKIAKEFSQKYDNPTYSLDFGIDKSGKPYIFEINDQIGFPKWEMKNRDSFLKELVVNFKNKLKSPVGDLLDLGGSLKTNKPPLTNEELDDVVAQAVIDDFNEA